MKVWEAINLLQNMNPSMDVTLVFGEIVSSPKFQPNPPHWTPQYPNWFTAPQWPRTNEITCGHTSQYGDH